jgi:hypothetical protein
VSSAVPLANVSAQMIILDNGHPDGYQLSQLNQLHVVTSSTTTGPVGDDVALTLIAGMPLGPNGGCILPTVSLYGTTYTQYHVITNGRITMGVANTDYNAVATYLSTDPAFAGSHVDFNTAIGGNITVSTDGTSVTANYNGIGYFGQAGTSSTFSVVVGSTGDVTIANFGLGTPTATRNAFIGVHPGGAVAIEPGFPANYVGSVGSPFVGTSGFSHGVFGDLFTGPLADSGETLSFVYNGSGYTVFY